MDEAERIRLRDELVQAIAAGAMDGPPTFGTVMDLSGMRPAALTVKGGTLPDIHWLEPESRVIACPPDRLDDLRRTLPDWDIRVDPTTEIIHVYEDVADLPEHLR